MDKRPSRADQRRAALRRFMADNELESAAWARSAQVSSSTLYNFLNGDSESLSRSTEEKLALSLGKSIEEMWGAGRRVGALLLGAVGGDGMVESTRKQAFVDVPFFVSGDDLGEDLIAVDVPRGQRLGSFNGGTRLFFKTAILAESLGLLCLIELAGEEWMVGRVEGDEAGGYVCVPENPTEQPRTGISIKAIWQIRGSVVLSHDD